MFQQFWNFFPKFFQVKKFIETDLFLQKISVLTINIFSDEKSFIKEFLTGSNINLFHMGSGEAYLGNVSKAL